MEHVKQLFAALNKHFEKLAQTNAVIAKPISIGDRHVVPLCELNIGLGGGGGSGEMIAEVDGQKKAQEGVGGGAGGAAKATPVATLVIDGDKVRLQPFND